ncbi:hypothetical protein ACSBL2_01990 [Pedobacter sp. AW31-3R]|uniref:hypothetical protein n=1 Tax=Pedobacter sp. AW31-3R TaxID=3445781 RepID=UPI003FA0F82E
MKKYIKNIKGLSLILFACVLLMTSCEKKDYLDEGGLSVAETPLNTYDYLAAHPVKLFDTLLLVVDHYALKEEINNSGTFFAPTDYSIKLYLTYKQDILRRLPDNQDAVYGLAEMFSELPADSVRQYLFNEKITMNSLTTTPTVYTSKGETEALLSKTLQTDPQYYQWSSEPVYFMYYGKMYGQTLTSVQCQTTGILTQSGNGTVLHVLRNTHRFVNFSL